MRLVRENLRNISEDRGKKSKNKRTKRRRESIVFDASHWLMRAIAERTLELLSEGNADLEIREGKIHFNTKNEAKAFRSVFMTAYKEKRVKWKLPPEWAATLIHATKRDDCEKELGIHPIRAGMSESEVLNTVFNNRLKISVLPLMTWIKYVSECNGLDPREVINKFESDEPEEYLPLLVKVGTISRKEYEAWIEYKRREEESKEEGEEGDSDEEEIV